jgi:hypothetical protein
MLSEKSGTLKLIATDYNAGEDAISLVPTNVTSAEGLESPALVSLLIPRDTNRTHLFLAVGAEREWTQVPSAAPYLFGGSYRFLLTSSALPPPGRMGMRLPFDTQTEFQPSAVQINRFSDPNGSIGLDTKIMAFLVRGNFPTLTREQALSIAQSLLQSEVKIEMVMAVRMRSVESLTIGSAYLQVWGD